MGVDIGKLGRVYGENYINRWVLLVKRNSEVGAKEYVGIQVFERNGEVYMLQKRRRQSDVK